MAKYTAMIPVSEIGSSHSFFMDRMTARPIRKARPKGWRTVRRTGIQAYRKQADSNHWSNWY